MFPEESFREFFLLIQDVNLAERKPTWQSSMAVDRNASKFNDSSYIREQSWWIVDLENVFGITHLEITNRGDCYGKKSYSTLIGQSPNMIFNVHYRLKLMVNIASIFHR